MLFQYESGKTWPCAQIIHKRNIVPAVKETIVDNRKINPGSVVGGPNMITKIFPYSEDSETMNQYEYVESSYTRLSNSGYLGPLSGLIVKSMLGDRIVDQDYKVASQSLSSFIMEAALAENSQSYNQAFSPTLNPCL